MTDWSVACHRAGGRRAYNARRQLQALLRQRQLVTLLRQPGLGLTDRGAQAAIARLLGVHRSTIHRDIRALQRDFWARRRRGRRY